MAPNGYLHAGTVVGFADSACGYGCILNLPDGATGFTTIELKTNFLRSAREGTIECEARMVHGGRTTQLWDATVTDAGGPDDGPLPLHAARAALAGSGRRLRPRERGNGGRLKRSSSAYDARSRRRAGHVLAPTSGWSHEPRRVVAARSGRESALELTLD